jgi:hypothetical protein
VLSVGATVSMVTFRPLETLLMLPASSVAVAVIDFAPLESAEIT